MKASKRTCCRAMPRCAACPVRLAARRTAEPSAPAAATEEALVEEILRGRAPRALPPAVLQALAGPGHAARSGATRP